VEELMEWDLFLNYLSNLAALPKKSFDYISDHTGLSVRTSIIADSKELANLPIMHSFNLSPADVFLVKPSEKSILEVKSSLQNPSESEALRMDAW